MSAGRVTAQCLVVSVLVSLSADAQTGAVARGWTGLWGASRNGEAPAGPAAPRKPRELWRRTTAGGYSEVVAVGDAVYTTELRGDSDFVIALDADTGRDRWSTRIGDTYRGHGGSHDGPIGTPAVADTDLFATGPHGVVIALDRANGRERWRHDLVREFDATLPEWGFGASPLVEGRLVIVPTGGDKSRGLLAFERSTGRLVWNASHAKARAYASAVAATIGGVRQIIAAAGDRIYSVAPTDGRLLWSANGPGSSAELANSPIVIPDNGVLVTAWDQSLMLNVSRQNGTFAAALRWESPRLRAFNGPSIYRDGVLYGFAGPQLICIDARTGDVRWRERTGEGTLVGLGGHLLFLGQTSGDLQVLRAAPDRFVELLRARVLAPGTPSVTGPSVANGRIYIRNIREMAAFQIQ